MAEKEKGMPAIMRCFDRAKIYVKAGDGGNGVLAFRRGRYVPLEGPSGGDGGRGGIMYVEVDGSLNSLLHLGRVCILGQEGEGMDMGGGRMEQRVRIMVVKLPPGTVVKEAAGKGCVQGDVLFELLQPRQRALLLPGGRGNASFKTGMNKVP